MCTKPQWELEDIEYEAILNMIIEAYNDRNFTIQSLIVDDDTIIKFIYEWIKNVYILELKIIFDLLMILNQFHCGWTYYNF